MRRLLVPAAVVVLAAGCGGERSEPNPPAANATGPALTVAEALEAHAEGPLLVRGFVYAGEGDLRLCDALAESYPPQCSGASIRVEGVSLSEFDGVEMAEGVSWTKAAVKILGDLENGALVVSDTAQG